MRDICQETLTVINRIHSLTEDELNQLYPDFVRLFDFLSLSLLDDCSAVLDKIYVSLDQIAIKKHQERD